MPNTLKRKSSPGLEQETESSKRRFAEAETLPQVQEETDAASSSRSESPPNDSVDENAAANPQQDRAARFAALRARNNDSRKANMKATTVETQRLHTDPDVLRKLNQKRETAQEKLLKADTEDAGEDFERKRAWDWTIDESEKWDRKLEKRRKNKQNSSFHDFTQDAQKVYKRQIREMVPNKEAYDREKIALIERAAASGGIEVVETEDGELIAVDRDGSFYSTVENTNFVQNKPSKEAVDKLVGELRKAEEVRLKKRKDRKGGDDGGDVTYINDKNKQVSSSAPLISLPFAGANLLYSSTKSWPGSTTSILKTSENLSSVELHCNNSRSVFSLLSRFELPPHHGPLTRIRYYRHVDLSPQGRPFSHHRVSSPRTCARDHAQRKTSGRTAVSP